MPGPKPTALKALEGGRGHRTKAEKAKAEREPKPPRDCPTAPAWLDSGAKRRWRALCDTLNEMGVLTAVDGDVLAVYCQAYSDHERLTRYLRTEGETTVSPTGYEMPRPEVSLRNRARDDMRKCGAELGIGAVARTKAEVKEKYAGPTALEKVRQRTRR